jgi:predicted nucleotidyltransferase component of viral defense system
MSSQIISILKSRLNDLSAHGEVDAETQRNALKEELQYYVLNFIYHHPQYGAWIMYGGSALRIIHGLDRMSVDLDFEISQQITEEYLNTLKSEIELHIINTYGADPDFLTIKITNGRGLLLRFHVGDALGIGHPSKQIHVKIDLNYFAPPETATERFPINHGQLSFVIMTYTMSTLMASKIAAIFLRGTRGVGGVFYEEKGRDIYDLLWYMGKKIVPDLDYITAKGAALKDPRALFDKLTLQMNRVSDVNLKQDLAPLFVDQRYIDSWLKNWRESYAHLLGEYAIRTVMTLERVRIFQDFRTDNFSFAFWYNTEEGKSVRISYIVSSTWIIDAGEGDIPTKIDASIVALFDKEAINFKLIEKVYKKIKQYATLFSEKTEKHLNKTNRIMIGDSITAKVIRMTADNLNQKEEIVLNRSALLSCELDDLLK